MGANIAQHFPPNKSHDSWLKISLPPFDSLWILFPLISPQPPSLVPISRLDQVRSNQLYCPEGNLSWAKSVLERLHTVHDVLDKSIISHFDCENVADLQKHDYMG